MNFWILFKLSHQTNRHYSKYIVFCCTKLHHEVVICVHQGTVCHTFSAHSRNVYCIYKIHVNQVFMQHVYNA